MTAHLFSALAPLSPLGTARQRMAAGPTPLSLDGDPDLGPEAAYLAWQVAAWAEALSARDREALGELVLRLLTAVAHGSTCLPLDPAAAALVAKVPDIVGAPAERKPLVVDRGFLYSQKLLACEDRVAAAINARAGRAQAAYAAAEPDMEAALQAACENATPAPTPEQRQAVGAALRGRLTIVSGGPGTGKTSIVLTLVRALIRLGVPPSEVALAAPTGKAANRLDEAMKAGDHPSLAQTLHRLLGYSPATGRFNHHRNNRLVEKVVIVDEGSMIDLVLMDRLLSALADDASLVLLGDADQLPSVDAGSVFRDLAAAAAPGVVRLVHSHRMDPTEDTGRRILEVAHAVREGNNITWDPEPAMPGIETLPASAREELLDRWYTRRVEAGADWARLAASLQASDGHGFDDEERAKLEELQRHFAAFRILCVTRGRPTGVEATNAWLHDRSGAPGGGFAPGEPVMMLRNDYDRGLYNGDQGVVVRVREARGKTARLMAAFPARAGWTAWDLDSLRDSLELGFATTVHKAQGSEFDDVAFLLPEAPLALLGRELIYTALTRSRRSVVVCGSPTVLAAGIANPLARSSGLGRKVSRVVPEGLPEGTPRGG